MGGLVDTGSDITIIGGELFRHVATTARLRKRQFKPPDRLPRAYNHQPFHLDGRMDLKVSFGEKDMITPVYVKMDAPDPLKESAVSWTSSATTRMLTPIGETTKTTKTTQP